MVNLKVSIIIPTYNRMLLIRETLDSIIAQTHKNWECIIVDDNSTDAIEEVIKSYSIADPRFRFYNRPLDRPKGANACRNYGFEQSTGDYINWFDSDDIMHVDFISDKLSILKNDIQVDFCCCINSTFKIDYTIVDGIDRPQIMQSGNVIEDYIFNGLYFFTHSPLWRKDFLLGIELFDETLFRSQERDFHFRVLLENPSYVYLDKVLFYKRSLGESISNSAGRSFLAQVSVYKYFEKVFNAILKRESITNRQKLLEYVFYRQLINFYNIAELAEDFNSKTTICLPLGIRIVKDSFRIKLPKTLRIKVGVGVVLTLLFKRGYSLLYYPQYNYRTYNE